MANELATAIRAQINKLQADQNALTGALTTLTFTAPGTPDYAIAAGTQTTPFGFTTADEMHTVLSVIANLQARQNAIAAKLGASIGISMEPL